MKPQTWARNDTQVSINWSRKSASSVGASSREWTWLCIEFSQTHKKRREGVPSSIIFSRLIVLVSLLLEKRNHSRHGDTPHSWYHAELNNKHLILTCRIQNSIDFRIQVGFLIMSKVKWRDEFEIVQDIEVEAALMSAIFQSKLIVKCARYRIYQYIVRVVSWIRVDVWADDEKWKKLKFTWVSRASKLISVQQIVNSLRLTMKSMMDRSQKTTSQWLWDILLNYKPAHRLTQVNT